MWGDRTLLRKIVMLLSFCFLPQFFYLFYAYGQVPGMAFLTIALYFAVRAIHKETGWCVVPMLLFIAAACVVRMNYAIGGIAMIIVYLLYALKRRKWIYLAVILCVGLSIVLPKNLVNYYYEKVADTDLSQGMPFSLHIAMGLQENEEPWRAAGWYNDFNDKTYLNSECDVGMAHRIAMKSIEDRLHTFLTNPGYAVDFFGEKIITTWCEPTFQSIWSGPLISMNNTTEVPLLHDLYSGGAVFGILASAMNALSVMIFGFSAAYILWKIFRDKSALNVLELFGIVFFMGGFLFHLAWETKSQYVYPYVILLIPVAGNGVHMVFSSLQKKIGEGRQRKSPISPS